MIWATSVEIDSIETVIEVFYSQNQVDMQHEDTGVPVATLGNTMKNPGN